MTSRLSPVDVLSTLTSFQRNSVAHAFDRLYADDGVDRFLVADQTGLGKTLVARGVIANVIEHLQHDPAVDRIDIIYVCSNQDLAKQNLRKLNVTADTSHSIASRLTLLAKHSRRFATVEAEGPKPVNLVSFTPGTSFSKGWRSGTAEERAMLWLLMEQAHELGPQSRRRDKSAYKVLRGSVDSIRNFERYVENLRRDINDDIDEEIRSAFLAEIRNEPEGEPSLLARMCDAMHGNGNREDHQKLISELRATLARESVRLLTPDLVILDEFQRFRELLDPETEAGQLAHHLFNFRSGEKSSSGRAKVLMLSATPFKPFTYREEAEQQGDNHRRDFLEVINFLGNGSANRPAERIQRQLAEYRNALISGNPSEDLAEEVRNELLKVMVRTERPSSEETAMSAERSIHLPVPEATELAGFAALKNLADLVEAPMSIEYWKAVPYFANFMTNYQLGRRVKQLHSNGTMSDELVQALKRTNRLKAGQISRLRPLPMGNSRMQHVHDMTIGKGWEQLLWLPPSLPYLEPGGPFQSATDVTKLLVFSSWTATPTAIASLLSYEAHRRVMGAGFRRLTVKHRKRDQKTRQGRLRFRLNATDQRAESMATLAVFWPMPGLARIGDPRAAARRARKRVASTQLIREVAAILESQHRNDREGDAHASFWFEAFRRIDSFPHSVDEEAAKEHFSQSDDADDPDSSHGAGVQRHVEEAFATRGASQDRPVSSDVLDVLAHVAAHSPGNIAYRALNLLRSPDNSVTEEGLWEAAVVLALALRTLFARPETTGILDQLLPSDNAYWRNILTYCEWGNLQAVLDEYIHHLAGDHGGVSNDDELLSLARDASEALTLRPSTYRLFNPDRPGKTIPISARFALRFGSGDDTDQGNVRLPQVRQSFNSPFWPFVLATTSIGQEGVDLHWWSHSLMHWNIPSNPVDFEQREGRVDRYQGHAVRKNIATRHGRDMLASGNPDPWTAGYELAAHTDSTLGSFAPHWVYPGPAKIVRHVAPFRLSVENDLLDEIKRKVALYRLTFGQPRQEDMLELISKNLVGVTRAQLSAMRLDLSAPPTD